MKVALVHDFLLKLGGAERVLKVLADLYPQAPIYTLLYDEAICKKIFPPSRVRTSFLQQFPAFIRKRQRYLLPWMPQAIESFDLSGYDLIISSSGAFSHGALTSSSSIHICYCHSPMRYAWDYTHEYLDEQNIGFIKRRMVQNLLHDLRIWDEAAADRPDIYLANSQHVARRIQKYYRKNSTVLYPPVDIERFEVSTTSSDYFLIVSTLSPFKKIDLAVQLFNKIGKKLVIIGSGSHQEYLKSIAGSNIQFLGFQTDLSVKKYLQNCRALVFPGEEDFGITPVEAMACGKPVLAYGEGGVRETVSPGISGEFFFEPTIDAMEDALGRLILNENRYNPHRIREEAERFSQKNFIRAFQKCVKEACASFRT